MLVYSQLGMDFKNRFIRASLRFFPTRRFCESEPRRILAIATTALGDTLWATPALASLRASFPKAYIGVLTRPIGMQIFKHNPHVDRLYLYEKPLRLWKNLYKDRFDTVLVFHSSQRLPLPIAAAAGASRIVGTAGLNKGLDDLLTDSLPNQRVHESVRRLQMVETIGGKISSETLSFYLQPEEREAVSLEKGSWIGIHPGSKDGFKRWPPSHFAKVGRDLQEKLGCRILVTGTEDERELMREVAEQIPGSLMLEPKLSLRQFAAIIERLSLLISNDTGPVHLACAIRTPVVAIYSSTDPFLCGPYKAKNSIAISRRPTCDPCLKRKCFTPFCFLQIGPDEVTEASLQIFLRSSQNLSNIEQ